MEVATKIKWEVGDFTQRFIRASEELEPGNSFRLSDYPDAEFSLWISQNSSVHLVCEELGGHETIEFFAKFWLETGGNKLFSCVKECAFKELSCLSPDFFPAGLLLRDLEKLVVDDTVTICFKIKRGDFGTDEPKRTGIVAFTEEIEKLHSEGKFDLKIQADDKEFKVYKNVLMCQSEIFKVMLTSPHFVEATANLIKFKDISAEDMKALVNWMHFAKIENFDEISCELYKAAHLYHIEPLMSACVQSMCKGFSFENIAPRVILAYIYEGNEVRASAEQFIQEQDRERVRELMSSEEWTAFAAKQCQLEEKSSEDLFNQLFKLS